jgi:hypothetical protein
VSPRKKWPWHSINVWESVYVSAASAIGVLRRSEAFTSATPRVTTACDASRPVLLSPTGLESR